MANILNYHANFDKFGSSRKQKKQPLEVKTLDFRVLMHCLNQQNLKNLKEAILLNVCKTNILVIIDKVFFLRRNILKAWLFWPIVFIIVFVVIFINSVYFINII